MTEENTPFRHMTSSLGRHMDNSRFHKAFIHDRIFFSGICMCLFWDVGYEDNSARCVTLCKCGK